MPDAFQTPYGHPGEKEGHNAAKIKPPEPAWEREMLHIFIVSPSPQQYTATGKHNY